MEKFFAAASALVPSSSSLAEAEGRQLGEAAGLDRLATHALLSASGWVASQAGSAAGIEKVRNRLLATKLGHQGWAEAVDAVARLTILIADKLTPLNEVESIMQSYCCSNAACDLRMISSPDTPLVPVAVVRIHVDEDETFVFQCLPGGLQDLIDTLKEASVKLGELQDIAQKFSKLLPEPAEDARGDA